MSRCRSCDSARSLAYYYTKRRGVLAQKVRLCPCGAPAVSSKHRYCGPCGAAVSAKRNGRSTSTRKTTERGYGSAHQRLRERWARVIQDEPVFCARCGLLIAPGQPWDLGHDDVDRSRYAGPEHRTCNRSAGAARGNRVRAQVL